MKKPKITDIPGFNKVTDCITAKNHFYLKTSVGFVHVNMDPEASPEVLEAFNKMVELAYNKK